jgi:UTP-glucose-1-phosphate uridylyltransferase
MESALTKAAIAGIYFLTTAHFKKLAKRSSATEKEFCTIKLIAKGPKQNDVFAKRLVLLK